MSENVDLSTEFWDSGSVSWEYEGEREGFKTKDYTKECTKECTKDSTPSAYSENFFHMTHDIPPPPFFINELKSKYNSNIKPRVAIKSANWLTDWSVIQSCKSFSCLPRRQSISSLFLNCQLTDQLLFIKNFLILESISYIFGQNS